MGFDFGVGLKYDAQFCNKMNNFYDSCTICYNPGVIYKSMKSKTDNNKEQINSLSTMGYNKEDIFSTKIRS